MTWKLLPRSLGEHYYFAGKQGIAVADQSIQRMSDPSSTDDGLLLIDEKSPVNVDLEYVKIPLLTQRGSGRGLTIERVKFLPELMDTIFTPRGMVVQHTQEVIDFAYAVYKDLEHN
jgi:hypothetical protein